MQHPYHIAGVNSLAPSKFSCNLKLVISKLISNVNEHQAIFRAGLAYQKLIQW